MPCATRDGRLTPRCATGAYEQPRIANCVPWRAPPLMKTLGGMSSTAKILDIVLTAVALVFGLAAVAAGMRVREVEAWRPVPCTIDVGYVTEQRTKATRGPRTFYTFDVGYAYSVDGQTFQGSRYSAGGKVWYSLAEAEDARQRAAAATSCFVNPRDSADAVLDRSADYLPTIGIASLSAVALWGLFVLRASRRGRLAVRESSATLPVAVARRQ